MMSDPRQPPIFPLTLLTGFLGAGKTSLLNKLLKAPELADALVLINEFGEVGLDHLFVEKVDGNLVVMASGCLCCTIRGDLVATLEDLLRRRDNDRIAPFNRIIIETTGLADPAPILHTIMYHPYFRLRLRLDGVVSVVDALHGAATLDRHKEAVKQAAVADRLVISKSDLLAPDDAGLAALRARLKALNPTAIQLDSARGDANPASLLNLGLYDPDKKIPDVRRWLNAEALEAEAGHDPHPAHHHDHDHDHDHHDPAAGHDVNRHDTRIRAFALRHPEPVSPLTLEMFLELLRTAHGAHLLRVKGIIALADDPARPLVIHGVQHIFHPPARLEAWPDADHTTRIVFILEDMEPSFVTGMWEAFVGLAADTPDAAALTQNPLKVAPGGLLA